MATPNEAGPQGYRNMAEDTIQGIWHRLTLPTMEYSAGTMGKTEQATCTMDVRSGKHITVRAMRTKMDEMGHTDKEDENETI